VITIPKKNYTGPTFAEALGIAINEAWHYWNTCFDVLYDLNGNLISIVQLNYFDGVYVHLVSGADLLVGKHWSSSIPKELIQSMNGVLRIGKTTYMISEAAPYVAYLDLHTTRNL
jgi:hypothetical protein